MVDSELYTDVLNYGKARLEYAANANIDDPRLEARELMGMALGMDCHTGKFDRFLYTSVDESVKSRFLALCNRRATGEPLQYILGEWDFYDLTFKVGRGVLIPRQDTETLVDVAYQKYRYQSGLTVFDLCAGSGCIGITIEKRLNCEQVYMVESSYKAIPFLRMNKKMHSSNAKIITGDVLNEELTQKLPSADLIVSNPPYLTDKDMQNLQREVTYEPADALYGGEDGLDFYRGITMIWKSKLKNGGMLIYEVGNGQEDEVMNILIQHGFKNVRCHKDLCGVCRCVYGTFIEDFENVKVISP